MIGIGLDFGTTNSTVSIFDGKSFSYIEIDDCSENKIVMPTANYMDKNLVATIGTNAIKNYLKQNQGRLIRLKKEELGTIKVTYGETSTFKGREEFAGDTTVEIQIHAMVDKDMPGHLFRGLKRWLGRSTLETIRVFGLDYRVVALVTPILSHIRKKTVNHIKSEISSIHIGRPIRFEGHENDVNLNALNKLKEACEYAEVPNPTFYPEPLGATLSYLHSSSAKPKDKILTFDFGGGTLDLSIINKTKEGFDILATYGIPVGGDKINQLIYSSKIFQELGKDCIVKGYSMEGPTEELFQFSKFENGLINWQQTYTLNTGEYMDIINKTLHYNRNNIKVTEKLDRLKNLINWNYSYSVIKAIEQSKIDLSNENQSLIDVTELGLSVTITKIEFEKIISGILKEVDEAINRTLNIANLEPERISKVIRTGGSSQIPSIINLLEKKFPDKVVEYDVFKSIAAGLAIANYFNYKFD